jgi:phage protein D
MISSTYSTFSNRPFSVAGRQPRAIVTINDVQVYWEDIEVQTTTFYVADNYSITMPLNNQNAILDFNFWASEIDVIVKIYIGFPINPDSYGTADLSLFMVGDIDLINIDPLNGTIRLSGRDLTSRLIDTKTSNKYSSYSASQIATILAEKHGLTPIVTPTSGNVGTIYNNMQTLMTKENTEWDLIAFLAQQNGFVVFVNGFNLYFQPYPVQDPKTAFILQYQPKNPQSASPMFNGTDLQFKRSLTLARDVKVLVRVPYNPTTGKAFTVSAKATKRTRSYLKNVSASTAPSQTYSFIRAGLTREQAQQTANQLLSNITLQEIILEAVMPGDVLLKKDSIIQVRGTNSSFDQFYYTDIVYRNINYQTFTQRIIAKNHSVDSQVSL